MLSGVVVAGIHHHNSPVCAPQGPDEEYLVLVNMGEAPVDLRGWSVTNRKQDQVDHFRYLFPRFLANGDPWELEPGGLILLFTGRGTNGCTASSGEAHQFHLYQHRNTWVWAEPGDTACLYNRAGKLVSAYGIPGSSVRQRNE